MDLLRKQQLFMTRRHFFGRMASGIGTAALLGSADLEARTLAAGDAPVHARPVTSTLNVNGRDHRVTHDIRASLLDALREQLSLTGTRHGCAPQARSPARPHQHAIVVDAVAGRIVRAAWIVAGRVLDGGAPRRMRPPGMEGESLAIATARLYYIA